MNLESKDRKVKMKKNFANAAAASPGSDTMEETGRPRWIEDPEFRDE